MITDDEASDLRDYLWPGYVAGMVLLTWYLVTMPAGLMFFDAGELALVGYQQGLGHPPGQPLYTLLLGVSVALWPGDPLIAMNSLSALAAAGCAIPIDRLMLRAGQGDPRIRFVLLVVCGLAYPAWDQATRVELYTVSTLLVLIGISYGAHAIDRGEHRLRDWFILGFISGLVASVNPVHAIAVSGAVGLCGCVGLWRAGFKTITSRVGVAALGSIAGCLPYVHLAWVQGRTDRFIWGQLDSGQAVLSYLTGADYAHTDHSSWLNIGANLGDWMVWLTLHGFGPAMLIGLIGLLLNPWSRRMASLWFFPFTIAAIFSFSYGVFYPEVPDFSAYLLPTLWCSAIGIAITLKRTDGAFTHRLIAPITTVAIVFSLLFGTHLDRSKNDLARDLARTWIESIPQDGVLLIESDHLVFPMMYIQEVEGVRPDVVLINTGFTASRWYWESLYRKHPTLSAITLRPEARGDRLRTFLSKNQDRPQYAESVRIAGMVHVRPCLVTWGVALGAECLKHNGATPPLATDTSKAFSRALKDWWNHQYGEDPISGRVLASLGASRAEAALALGLYTTALKALRDGIPPSARPSPPANGLTGEALRIGDSNAPLLIGHPTNNLAIGRRVLNTIGMGADHSVTRSWSQAANHPDLRWD